MDVEKIREIVAEAKAAAYEAADEYFKTTMGGQDRGACGFAWVNIYRYNDKQIDGRTKIGRAMKKAGIEQDWNRVYMIWNPAGYRVQNIDTLEAGARAAAEVFNKYGFTAYASSRLD